jgi:hypothetical protein
LDGKFHKLECKECGCEIKPQLWGNGEYRCACWGCGKVINLNGIEIEIKENEGEKIWQI